MFPSHDRRGGVVGEYSTAAEAAREGGFDASHITKVLRGLRSSHGGYRWKYEEGEVDQEVNKEFKEARTSDFRKDSAVLTAKTEKSIQSLEEAIEFFEIDTDKWEVERWIANSWDVSMKNKDGTSFKRTNYQVKVFLKQREPTLDEVLEDINIKLQEYTPKIITHTNAGEGIITVELADFHIGAEVKDLMRVADFDIGIISNYFTSIADIVNEYKAKSVIINMHGDFFESITGLNHMDSWKGMGSRS